jgi:hypothetical protein
MVTSIQIFCDNLHSSNEYQLNTRLDIGLGEFWKHMMGISRWSYQRKQKRFSMKMHPTEGRKEFAQRQSKGWDPGRLQSTTCNNKVARLNGEQQQHKIWDPGRWRKIMKEYE